MMFRFIGAIILYTLSFLNSVWKCHMSLLLAILLLGDSRIHICTLDGCNITSNIERPVNKIFSIKPTLSILVSIQTIAISDLGKALITYSFDVSDKLLNMWLDLIIISTKYDKIGILEFSMR